MSYSIIEDNSGYILKDILWIAPESESIPDSIIIISKEEANINFEEPLQLKEGCSYEYEILIDQFKLDEIPGIIQTSKRHSNRGRISPGNYVGRLPLKIISDKELIEIAVEVRSSKSDYRTEYRKMLEDITFECTDLLMIHSSPVTQKLTVDYGNDSESLYQRFSFVQSMIDSEDFQNAIQRIINSPITRWKDESEELDSRRLKSINSKHIRQIASGSNRIPLPKEHPKSISLKSIPQKLSTTIKTDTLDNPENRFIKLTLNEFARFTGFVCQKIEESERSNKPNVYYEAKILEEKLSEILSHNIFREVSQVKTIPMNNPVLQRKEGYREIFRIWLMYDLAAKLIWDGLDNDTYFTGKRDVATLYEYWLFFKLLRLIEGIFKIDPKETKELIKETSDGLGLQLKSGKHTAVKGVFQYKNRELSIKFNYNRTFTNTKYPEGGSWSQQMRPDYTLSIWPKGFTEEEAEKQELIVHIHFDAKYKVEDLQYLLSLNEKNLSKEEKNQQLNVEKEKEKQGSYKRADLLKMHAYKDAIRRTVGAYVLYPGTKFIRNKGFHEIVPGLGAFPVSPSNNGEGLGSVKKFIYEILDHFSDRASQRESLSYHTYKIMKDDKMNSIHKNLPEYFIKQGDVKGRYKPPQEVSILIGYVQEKQKDWIKNNCMYDVRMDQYITPSMTGADYLLLYESIADNREIKLWENGLYKIIMYPKIKNSDWLKERNYQNPDKPEYFIYKISSDVEEWSKDKIKKIIIPENIEDYKPFTFTLSEILS